MAYQFPPELEERVREHMASGQYASEDQLLTDAFLALDDVQTRQARLREEIQQRVAKSGRGDSSPLDRVAFKEEARRRSSNKS